MVLSQSPKLIMWHPQKVGQPSQVQPDLTNLPRSVGKVGQGVVTTLVNHRSTPRRGVPPDQPF